MSGLDHATIDRLRLVSTATLTTQLFKRGLRNAFMQGVRPLARSAAIWSARPSRCATSRRARTSTP